jgi:hypothetical protein
MMVNVVPDCPSYIASANQNLIFMKLYKNLGTVDKVIRLLVSAVILLLFALGLISGPLAAGLLALAVVLTITAFFSFCPLYQVLGIKHKRDGVS